MPDRPPSADFQPEARVIQGDALAVLRTLEAESVHCVVTSPPYWSLRDYGTGTWEGGDAECPHRIGGGHDNTHHSGDVGPRNEQGNAFRNSGRYVNQGTAYRDTCGKCGATRVDKQLGLESTVQEYVANIVEVFREVRRVLRSDGTFWLNIGDSFNGIGGQGSQEISGARGLLLQNQGATGRRVIGLKPKDKCMIPARVAIALQDDGWYLRQEIVWCKRAPMPESTRDRPTTAHEMVYLFAKSGDTTYYTHPHKPGVRGEVPPPDYRWLDNVTGERTAIEPVDWRTELMEDGKTKRWRRINLWEGHDYFYDQEAERVAPLPQSIQRAKYAYPAENKGQGRGEQRDDGGMIMANGFTDYHLNPAGRNLWSYWLLSPDSFSEAHFATFPRELARRCISLGTSAYGCCAECGAPWSRIVERSVGDWQERKAAGAVGGSIDKGHNTTHGVGMSHDLGLREVQTVGWAPTCTHSASVQPCTVLDPFSGAGTSGVVAVGLGRRYLGIELSPVYTEMSERRIAQTQPALPGLAV